ncbi:MAG: hypothetical protein K2M71_05525 [Duncaniella sp.]|nr:hypothetical protein [Duncaniella sp.]
MGSQNVAVFLIGGNKGMVLGHKSLHGFWLFQQCLDCGAHLWKTTVQIIGRLQGL